MAIELDYMEYANNAAAQAAYVSSDTANSAFISQTSADAEGLLGDYSNSEYSEGQSITLSTPTLFTGVSLSFSASVGSPAGQVTVRIETNSGSNLPSGTLADANLTKAITPTASAWNDFLFTTPAVLAAGTYWIVPVCDAQELNQRWMLNRKSLFWRD